MCPPRISESALFGIRIFADIVKKDHEVFLKEGRA